MIELISENIWPRLTKAAKACRRPAFVAVAYFGQSASRLLPLPEGSRLVVDASEGAVKSGQTCPAELKKLVTKGVRVFSLEDLHAKIFVFGSKVFVGSANASRHSSHTLLEAVVATTDRTTVSAARDLVRSLCQQELGPEELERLQGMYRPPRMTGNRQGTRKAKKSGPTPNFRPLFLAQLKYIDPPEGSESAEKLGTRAARKRMKRPRLHELEDFWWPGPCPFKRGDMVVQVFDQGNGSRMVYPPGNVIDTKPWSNGKKRCTFVYIERPKRQGIALEELAKPIGFGAKKCLGRNGRLRRDIAQQLLAAFNT